MAAGPPGKAPEVSTSHCNNITPDHPLWGFKTLMPPWEESNGEAGERKHAKYQEVMEDCRAASHRGSYKVGFGLRGLIHGLLLEDKSGPDQPRLGRLAEGV